jgi:hypothetical protein
LPTRVFLPALIGLAALLRGFAVAFFPLEPLVDDAQFHRYALSMLAGHGYGAPGALAFFPPGMSLILTAWYFVTSASPLAGKILHLLAGCTLVWQVWALARHVLSERVARLAALLVAIFPTLVFYTATLGYETILALILVLVSRLTVYVGEQPGSSRLALVVIGMLLGIGTLLKPICLVVPVLLALAWWALGSRLTAAVSRAAVVAVVMALLVSPWTWRNYRVLGAFVPVSTNGGLTLWVANNPNATGLAMPTADPPPGAVGEVNRDRLRLRAAVAWIISHPRQWLSLALVKITYTWGTSSSIMSVVSTDRLPSSVEALCKAVLNIGWASLLVWCWATTATTRAWSWHGLIPATLFIAYIFVLHLFYEAISRHHIPVIPFLLMIGAIALSGEDRRDWSAEKFPGGH